MPGARAKYGTICRNKSSIYVYSNTTSKDRTINRNKEHINQEYLDGRNKPGTYILLNSGKQKRNALKCKICIMCY